MCQQSTSNRGPWNAQGSRAEIRFQGVQPHANFVESREHTSRGSAEPERAALLRCAHGVLNFRVSAIRVLAASHRRHPPAVQIPTGPGSG